MSKVYSLKDVAEHNTKQEPWFIIHDKVYNITKLLAEHPGGETVLMEFAGKDATGGFEGRNHSADARKWMKEFEIGTIGDKSKKWWPSCVVPSVALAIGVIGVAAVIAFVVHKSKQQ